ncbi:MAG: T9SS type A sorting domain-containing protein [Ignavibacteriaceae bacterium]|nr:T9SS type A sorting domain-containing protein [Ignavibacteriaceae bacterium]
MMKLFITVIIFLLFEPVFIFSNPLHTREMMMQIVDSWGEPVSKTVKLYKDYGNYFALYRIGTSESYWKWTAPNANVVCDIGDNNTEEPTWDPIEPGDYLLWCDNKFATLHINVIPIRDGDFNIKFQGGFFTIIFNNRGVTLGSTQNWNKLSVNFNQLKSDGSTDVGTVSIGQGSSFSDRLQAPFEFNTNTNDTYLFDADPDIYNSEKYHHYQNIINVRNFREQYLGTQNYNTTASFNPTFDDITIQNVFVELPSLNTPDDIIQFKDPWLIDYNDPQHGNKKRNRGQNDAVFQNLPTPFYPDYTTNYNGNSYKGIFLDQDPQQGLPNYSVRSPIQQPNDIFISQTGKYHKFYFYNWGWSGTDPLTQNNIVNDYYETPVVFRNGNANVTANLKGTELSNDPNAFSSNSQKKLVRDSYGYLHKVYTSMGKVWYERSTDNGTSWSVQNFGKPLSTNQSKLPAIDEYGGDVVIVWQEEWSAQNTYKIRMAYNNAQGSELIFNDVFDWYEGAIEPAPYSSDASPVVCWVHNHIFVCWRINNGCLSSSLYFKYGTGGPFWPLVWQQFYGLDGTDGNSSNPTTSSKKDPNSPLFHLAWQQGTTAIKYCNLIPDGTNITISSIETPSSGDGFSYKINPSISIKYDGYPTLVYVGSLYQSATTQVTKRSRSSSSWGTFAKYGANVNSPTEYNSIIVWSEGNANKLYRPWSSIRTLSTFGQYVQMSNGSSSMYAIAFKQYTSPSYFQTSPNLVTLPKVNSLINECGREGIVAKGEAEFYFILGDVIVDNEVINFPEVEDTTNIANTNELNLYMKTNSFSINESSEFSFSIAYGAVDSLKALNELTGESRIHFSLELIDASTNEIIGELDDIILDAANIYTCQIQSFQVNTQSIGSRMVKLRVTTNTNFNGAYNLADILTEEEVLGKRDFEELNFSGESLVTSYDMFQNYPNPFNPATTIKYQIPHSGNVTLKVFDILGSEIATLVNGVQNEGKYEINFDASNLSAGRQGLSSGVYIYTIQVNEFISSKKMILLK